MTTTISKKNKHTKPASKKRTGKRIGIRNTKRRSKNSKKSKTSKKNKPKNRLYKGGDNNLVESIKRVVNGYNRKVLLKKNESDKSGSDSDSIDGTLNLDNPLNLGDVQLADAINTSDEEINKINNLSKLIGDSHSKIAYSRTTLYNLNDEIISETKRGDIIADATNVKDLLKNIIKKLPEQDNLVEKSLESNSEFIKAVNEYQQHINENKSGYIENTNDVLLLHAIDKINTDYKNQSDCC
tara:strand:- start:11843 stop:12562 length:720 start_codon:yes stop_codon:yes gene_type:complete